MIAVLADPPAQAPTLEQAPLATTLGSIGEAPAGAASSVHQAVAAQADAPLLRADAERTLLHASPSVDPKAVPAAAAPRAPWRPSAQSEATLQVFSAEPMEEHTPSLPPSGHASDRTLISSDYLRSARTAGAREDGAARPASAHAVEQIRSPAAGTVQTPALPRPTGPMGTLLELPALAGSPEASALPPLPSGSRGSVAPLAFSPGFQPVTPTRTQLNDGIGSLASSAAQAGADWNLQDTDRPLQLPPIPPASSRAWRIGLIGLSALALAGIGWAVVYLRVADRRPPGEQTTLANHPAPVAPDHTIPAPAVVPVEPPPQIKPVPKAATRSPSTLSP
jgi:hypothetical protein